MEDTRLPKQVKFGELVGGAGCVGGHEKEWVRCFLDDLRVFGINDDQYTTGLRHAEVYPNMTRRAKERIAQSKRARAGSLVIDD